MEDMADYLLRMNKQLDEMSAQHLQTAPPRRESLARATALYLERKATSEAGTRPATTASIQEVPERRPRHRSISMGGMHSTAGVGIRSLPVPQSKVAVDLSAVQETLAQGDIVCLLPQKCSAVNDGESQPPDASGCASVAAASKPVGHVTPATKATADGTGMELPATSRLVAVDDGTDSDAFTLGTLQQDESFKTPRKGEQPTAHHKKLPSLPRTEPKPSKRSTPSSLDKKQQQPLSPHRHRQALFLSPQSSRRSSMKSHNEPAACRQRTARSLASGFDAAAAAAVAPATAKDLKACRFFQKGSKSLHKHEPAGGSVASSDDSSSSSKRRQQQRPQATPEKAPASSNSASKPPKGRINGSGTRTLSAGGSGRGQPQHISSTSGKWTAAVDSDAQVHRPGSHQGSSTRRCSSQRSAASAPAIAAADELFASHSEGAMEVTDLQDDEDVLAAVEDAIDAAAAAVNNPTSDFITARRRSSDRSSSRHLLVDMEGSFKGSFTHRTSSSSSGAGAVTGLGAAKTAAAEGRGPFSTVTDACAADARSAAVADMSQELQGATPLQALALEVMGGESPSQQQQQRCVVDQASEELQYVIAVDTDLEQQLTGPGQHAPSASDVDAGAASVVEDAGKPRGEQHMQQDVDTAELEDSTARISQGSSTCPLSMPSAGSLMVCASPHKLLEDLPLQQLSHVLSSRASASTTSSRCRSRSSSGSGRCSVMEGLGLVFHQSTDSLGHPVLPLPPSVMVTTAQRVKEPAGGCQEAAADPQEPPQHTTGLAVARGASDQLSDNTGVAQQPEEAASPSSTARHAAQASAPGSSGAPGAWRVAADEPGAVMKCAGTTDVWGGETCQEDPDACRSAQQGSAPAAADYDDSGDGFGDGFGDDASDVLQTSISGCAPLLVPQPAHSSSADCQEPDSPVKHAATVGEEDVLGTADSCTGGFDDMVLLGSPSSSPCASISMSSPRVLRQKPLASTRFAADTTCSGWYDSPGTAADSLGEAVAATEGTVHHTDSCCVSGQPQGGMTAHAAASSRQVLAQQELPLPLDSEAPVTQTHHLETQQQQAQVPGMHHVELLVDCKHPAAAEQLAAPLSPSLTVPLAAGCVTASPRQHWRHREEGSASGASPDSRPAADVDLAAPPPEAPAAAAAATDLLLVAGAAAQTHHHPSYGDCQAVGLCRSSVDVHQLQGRREGSTSEAASDNCSEGQGQLAPEHRITTASPPGPATTTVLRPFAGWETGQQSYPELNDSNSCCCLQGSIQLCTEASGRLSGTSEQAAWAADADADAADADADADAFAESVDDDVEDDDGTADAHAAAAAGESGQWWPTAVQVLWQQGQVNQQQEQHTVEEEEEQQQEEDTWAAHDDCLSASVCVDTAIRHVSTASQTAPSEIHDSRAGGELQAAELQPEFTVDSVGAQEDAEITVVAQSLQLSETQGWMLTALDLQQQQQFEAEQLPQGLAESVQQCPRPDDCGQAGRMELTASSCEVQRDEQHLAQMQPQPSGGVIPETTVSEHQQQDGGQLGQECGPDRPAAGSMHQQQQPVQHLPEQQALQPQQQPALGKRLFKLGARGSSPPKPLPSSVPALSHSSLGQPDPSQKPSSKQPSPEKSPTKRSWGARVLGHLTSALGRQQSQELSCRPTSQQQVAQQRQPPVVLGDLQQPEASAAEVAAASGMLCATEAWDAVPAAIGTTGNSSSTATTNTANTHQAGASAAAAAAGSNAEQQRYSTRTASNNDTQDRPRVGLLDGGEVAAQAPRTSVVGVQGSLPQTASFRGQNETAAQPGTCNYDHGSEGEGGGMPVQQPLYQQHAVSISMQRPAVAALCGVAGSSRQDEACDIAARQLSIASAVGVAGVGLAATLGTSAPHLVSCGSILHAPTLAAAALALAGNHLQHSSSNVVDGSVGCLAAAGTSVVVRAAALVAAWELQHVAAGEGEGGDAALTSHAGLGVADGPRHGHQQTVCTAADSHLQSGGLGADAAALGLSAARFPRGAHQHQSSGAAQVVRDEGGGVGRQAYVSTDGTLVTPGDISVGDLDAEQQQQQHEEAQDDSLQQSQRPSVDTVSMCDHLSHPASQQLTGRPSAEASDSSLGCTVSERIFVEEFSHFVQVSVGHKADWQQQSAGLIQQQQQHLPENLQQQQLLQEQQMDSRQLVGAVEVCEDDLLVTGASDCSSSSSVSRGSPEVVHGAAVDCEGSCASGLPVLLKEESRPAHCRPPVYDADRYKEPTSPQAFCIDVESSHTTVAGSTSSSPLQPQQQLLQEQQWAQAPQQQQQRRRSSALEDMASCADDNCNSKSNTMRPASHAVQQLKLLRLHSRSSSHACDDGTASSAPHQVGVAVELACEQSTCHQSLEQQQGLLPGDLNLGHSVLAEAQGNAEADLWCNTGSQQHSSQLHDEQQHSGGQQRTAADAAPVATHRTTEMSLSEYYKFLLQQQQQQQLSADAQDGSIPATTENSSSSSTDTRIRGDRGAPEARAAAEAAKRAGSSSGGTAGQQSCPDNQRTAALARLKRGLVMRSQQRPLAAHMGPSQAPSGLAGQADTNTDRCHEPGKQPPRPRSSSPRRGKPQQHQGAGDGAASGNDATAPAGEGAHSASSGASSSTEKAVAPKPYLKRRSQQVAGRRLDWSNVQSKTQTRLDSRFVPVNKSCRQTPPATCAHSSHNSSSSSAVYRSQGSPRQQQSHVNRSVTYDPGLSAARARAGLRNPASAPRKSSNRRPHAGYEPGYEMVIESSTYYRANGGSAGKLQRSLPASEGTEASIPKSLSSSMSVSPSAVASSGAIRQVHGNSGTLGSSAAVLGPIHSAFSIADGASGSGPCLVSGRPLQLSAGAPLDDLLQHVNHLIQEFDRMCEH